MLDLEVNNRVALLALTHGKVNAMDLELVRGLTEELERLDRDNKVDRLILAGNSRVFSAGVDLKRLIAEEMDYLDLFLPALEKMFETALRFSKPMIAAVAGHAVAGGCVLACAADYRIIADSAKVGVPELRVGVAFPCVALEIMREAVAAQAFREIINVGATFAGQSAVDVGLADLAVSKDQVIDQAFDAAERFSAVPAQVFRLTKLQLRQPVFDRIERGEERFGEEIRKLWRSEDVRGAIRNYVGKRLK